MPAISKRLSRHKPGRIPFYLDGRASINPIVGQHSSLTAASTITTEDFEGVYRTTPANGSAHTGSREVYNLLATVSNCSSEDMTTNGWADGSGAVVDDYNTVTFTAGQNENNAYVQVIVTPPEGTPRRKFVVSAEVWCDSGTVPFRLKNTQMGVLNNYSSNFTATTTPQRFSFYVANNSTAGTGQQIAGVVTDTAYTGGVLHVSKLQIEDTTGASDPTIPNDYVSSMVGMGRDLLAGKSMSDWTAATGATVTAYNVLTMSAVTDNTFITLNNIHQSEDYIVSLTITNYASGSFNFSLGGTFISGSINANGVYSYKISAGSNSQLLFNGVSAFTGTITINSVKSLSHGSNLNGLEHFTYDNSHHSVDGNGVVTDDGTRTAIAASTLKGELCCPASTNEIIYNQVATGWDVGANVTAAVDSSISLDGVTSSIKISAISTSGYTFYRRSQSVTSGDTRTFSLLAKKGNYRYLGIRCVSNDAGNDHVVFDFDTETFVFVPASEIDSYSFTDNGGGVYEIHVTSTQNTTETRFYGVCLSNSSGSEQPSLSGNEYVYIQILNGEKLPFATPLIKTSGSTVTRTARYDVKKMPANYDDNLVISGEIYVHAANQHDTRRYIMHCADTGNDRFNIRLNDENNPKMQVVYGTGSSLVYLDALANYSANTSYKFLAWLNEDLGGGFWIDGVLQEASASVPAINKSFTEFNLFTGSAGFVSTKHLVIRNEKITQAQAAALAAAL